MNRVDPNGHYDLTTQSGRADWRRDHTYPDGTHWLLGDDGHGRSLTALDPGGHIYDMGINLSYGGPSGILTGASFADPRMLPHPGNEEWDYLVATPHGGDVLVRNFVDNTGAYGPEFPGQPHNPKDIVTTFGGAADPKDPRFFGAITYAPDQIWANGEVLMNSVLLAHELGHVAQQRESKLGWFGYIAGYSLQEKINAERVNSHNPHAVHEMEVDANRRAGLPSDWDGRNPPGYAQDSYRDDHPRISWTFHLPDGL